MFGAAMGATSAARTLPEIPQHVVQCNAAGNRRSSRLAAVEPAASVKPVSLVEDVPVVDLAEVRAGNPCGHQRIAAACRDWGFFQVVNHGVSMELVQELRKQSLAVFALPQEKKDALSKRHSGGSLWGYDFRPNHGPLEVFQVNAWDNQQLLDKAQQLFPNSSEDFVEVYEEANLALRTLAMEILDLMILGLRVDGRHFQAHKKDSQGVMRANYYHQSSAVGERVLGLIPHVDGNLLTILHQQDVCGLEVLMGGRWVSVHPQTDSFCINVADIMQVLSNGQYRSIQHRAVVPTTNTRLSIAYFLTPSSSETTMLQAAPELVDSQRPALYRPFTWAEFRDVARAPGRPWPSILPYFEATTTVASPNTLRL